MEQSQSVQESCPTICSSNCLPSCPSFCCKVSPPMPSACPSSCSVSCLPPCQQHCCQERYPPNFSTQSPPICPSQCAIRCDNMCPAHCCPASSEQSSFLTKSTPVGNVQPNVSPLQSYAAPTPCPSSCSSYCSHGCPQYCCMGREISPYLFKTPEQTVSPVGRSLAVLEADYKSKVVHRLSELLSSPLKLCEPSCFSNCSVTCPNICCDVGRKKKMFVYKRKKKAQITKPRNKTKKTKTHQ